MTVPIEPTKKERQHYPKLQDKNLKCMLKTKHTVVDLSNLDLDFFVLALFSCRGLTREITTQHDTTFE